MPSNHMSKASSRTSMPSRSQASSIAGLATLWELRTALKPAALRISIRRSSARPIAAAPSGPLSWWMHAPRSFTDLPLIRKPRLGVQLERPDAERRGLRVSLGVAVEEGGARLVEGRAVGVPQRRVLDAEALPHHGRHPGSD